MTSEMFSNVQQIFSSLYMLFKWTIPGTVVSPMFIITAPWIVAASIRVFKAITGNAAGGFGEVSSFMGSFDRASKHFDEGGKKK